MSGMSGIDPSSIAIASLSDIGLVRATNQDYCDIFKNSSGSRLLVVADGMGGHRGGATASRVATEAIGEAFRSATGEPADVLSEAIRFANQRVHQQSIDNPDLRGMGTTVVALLFDAGGRVWVAHVGDSRAYQLHATGMEQITQDHSVVGEMVRRGLITKEEADVHPRRNEILRSVGIDEQVEIDITQILTAPGDLFILCSDGLTGLVPDRDIAQVLQSELPENAAKQLVAMANESGGLDNITVQIARLPRDATDSQSLDAPVPDAQPHEVESEAAIHPLLFKLMAWMALAFIGLVVGYLMLGTSRRNPATPSPGSSAIEDRAEVPASVPLTENRQQSNSQIQGPWESV